MNSNTNGNATGWNVSEEPIYNIGVVARMTGIPVATLRVWERRYQFPTAERTEGGQVERCDNRHEPRSAAHPAPYRQRLFF